MFAYSFFVSMVQEVECEIKPGWIVLKNNQLTHLGEMPRVDG